MQTYGIVYLTTNTVTGKQYIGMCKNTHADSYFGSGKLIKQAIKKYGGDAFTREILEECGTREELSNAERKWIDKLDAINSDAYYNLVRGGWGGNSESLQTYWQAMTPDERKTARNWHKPTHKGMLGKKHSDETKKLIGSKSINRAWKSQPHTESLNPNAKGVQVIHHGVKTTYKCLKTFSYTFPSLSYSYLKKLAQTEKYNQKHELMIKYV